MAEVFTGGDVLEEFFAQGVGDLFWVGLCGGGTHDLAGEEVDEFFVAGLDGGSFVGVFEDDLFYEGVELVGGAGFEAFFLDEGGDVFFGFSDEGGE